VVAGVAVLLLAPRAHWAAALPRRRQAQELHRQVVAEVQRRALAHLLPSRAALAQLLGRLTPRCCPILQKAGGGRQAPERRLEPQPTWWRELSLEPELAL
jgi:hypothetical protein